MTHFWFGEKELFLHFLVVEKTASEVGAFVFRIDKKIKK